MLSNLDTNILENYGEGELQFTQNSVPFDFDGKRLLYAFLGMILNRWMEYVTKDNRDVYIYDFDLKQKRNALSFTRRDGLVSHMRFCGECLFYVKNTKDVVMYDMRGKSSVLVGTCRDAVLAMCVGKHGMVRDFDKGIREEEHKHEVNHVGIEVRDDSFQVACVDESENVYLFRNITVSHPKPSVTMQKVKEC